MKTDAEKWVFEPFDNPVFDKPQIEWQPGNLSWEAVMKETESVRRYYLENYDTPEKRLRDKNPEPFRMD
jgi:hypothetical protein